MRAIVHDMPREDEQHCEGPKAARRYAVGKTLTAIAHSIPGRIYSFPNCASYPATSPLARNWHCATQLSRNGRPAKAPSRPSIRARS